MVTMCLLYGPTEAHVNTMRPKKLSPAELARKRFGGSRKLSRLLEGSESRVSKWIARGGVIPSENGMHKKLLELARQQGVRFTEKELVHGGY